jgi:hypothetical protein
MNVVLKSLIAAGVVAIGAGQAQATTFDRSLTGVVANFSESQFNFSGLHFDRFDLPLSGLDSSDSFTVAQGDIINEIVTLDTPYTIPTSMVRTDILQYLTGSSFPSENTGVDGTFTFFLGGSQVGSFGYSSTTSSSLASFAANFPPNNGAFTWDSFTNGFTINTLATPATLDGSFFEYELASTPVPEPAAWAMMLVGFGLIGGAMRTQSRAKTATLTT